MRRRPVSRSTAPPAAEEKNVENLATGTSVCSLDRRRVAAGLARGGGDAQGGARGAVHHGRVRLCRGAAGLDVLLPGAAVRSASAGQRGGLARRLGSV